MRLIDADALKELFSEVIGHIAIKPEMNGNLEHMIRASAMVIQMIDDAPTVQPDTTTHDSIPAETGKNDGDRTSGDCISRTQAIDVVAKWIFEVFGIKESDGTATVFKRLRELPSAQTEIIRCTECKHYREYDSEYVENAVVVQCMADRYPISETIPDGWFCAGAERKDDE